MRHLILGALAVAAMPAFAMAGGHTSIGFSFGIGVSNYHHGGGYAVGGYYGRSYDCGPRYYHHDYYRYRAPVYCPPPVVYYRPAPVYVAPPPVVYAPAPVVVQQQAPVVYAPPPPPPAPVVYQQTTTTYSYPAQTQVSTNYYYGR